MAETLKSKIDHFLTLRVFNYMLMGIGKMLTPFSKISNEPVHNNAEFEWAGLIEANADKIKAEVMALLQHDEYLPNVQDIQPAEEKLSADSKWKTFFLYGFGLKADKNCAKCPETTKVLEQIPNLLTAFFSILYPGKHIPPHKGIFKGIVRTHLGLLIPANGECKMRVGNKIVKWENGKAVFFDDTYTHEVWNNTDGIRVVLLIDTVRPYTNVGSKINNFIIDNITKSVYVKDALKKNEEWEKVYYNVFP